MTGTRCRTMTARLRLLRRADNQRTETAVAVRTATRLAITTTTAAILRVRATGRPHVMVIETASCSHLAMIESLILLLVATLLPALSPATPTSESEYSHLFARCFDAPADSRRACRTAPNQSHDKEEEAGKEEGEVTFSLDPVEEPDPEAILAERRRKRAEILAKYANNPPPPPPARSETATPSASDLLPRVDAFKKREGDEEEGSTPGREQVERAAKRLRIQGTGALHSSSRGKPVAARAHEKLIYSCSSVRGARLSCCCRDRSRHTWPRWQQQPPFDPLDLCRSSPSRLRLGAKERDNNVLAREGRADFGRGADGHAS